MTPSYNHKILLNFLALISLSTLLIAGCATNESKTIEYGVSQDKVGYVPARIAVLSCRNWPITAHLKNSPKDLKSTELKAAEKEKIINELCQKTDSFVLSGFKDQPYMKGFSPKGTHKLLAKAKQSTLLDQFAGVWGQRPSDCNDCSNEPSFYNATIAQRPDWQTWLSQLSQATKNSDAVLIPFVVFVNKAKNNDRGLLSAKLSAAVALFLIDTGSGDLIWSNQRSASASNKSLTGKSKSFPKFPSWQKIYDNSLSSALWKDFPGRLVY